MLRHLSILLIFLTGNLSALELWVTNLGNDTVSIFDTTTNALLDTIATSDGMFSAPEGINFSRDGTLCYILNNGNSTISVINVATRTLKQVISGNGLNGLFLAAINPKGTLYYVTDYNADTISVFALPDNNPVGAPIPSSGGPYPIQFTPDGSSFYVGNFNIGTISLIDPFSLNVSTINGPFSEISSIAISLDGKIVYTANLGNNSVAFFPTKTTTPAINLLTADTFASPNFVTMSPNGAFLYVISNGGGPLSYLSIINSSNQQLVGKISQAEGNFSNPLCLSLTPDGLKGFVVNSADSSVSVIDTATNTYITSIVGQGLSTPTTSEINNPTPYPPTDAKGSKIKNEFLTQTDYVSVLTWKEPKQGVTPIAYQIYSDINLTNLISTIPATGNLIHKIHNQNKRKNYTYYVVSISSTGAVSDPVAVFIDSKSK